MEREKRACGSVKLTVYALGFLVALSNVSCAKFSFPPQGILTDVEGNLILPMGPYQVAGDPGEILVGVQLPESKQGQVEEGVLTYWKDGDESEPFSVPFRPAWNRLQYVKLSNLEPGIDYQMRVSIPELKTVDHPIRVPEQSQNEFSFQVIGDTKPYPRDVASQLVQKMSERRAAFYVHLGDFARKGNHVGDWSNFLRHHRPLMRKMRGVIGGRRRGRLRNS